MSYLLYSIIIKISNLLKEEVHCQGTKLHRKSSTMRKHLNSMTSLINFNTKLIAKKSRQSQRPEISTHKQKSISTKYLFSVTSKRILKCTLAKTKWLHTQMKVKTNELMTWTHHLYFLKVKAVVAATFIQITIKMIKKHGIYFFLVVFDNSFRKMFYLLWQVLKNHWQSSWLTSYHNDALDQCW